MLSLVPDRGNGTFAPPVKFFRQNVEFWRFDDTADSTEVGPFHEFCSGLAFADNFGQKLMVKHVSKLVHLEIVAMFAIIGLIVVIRNED